MSNIYSTKATISKSDVKFGTSGARGLVSDLSPEVCISFTLGFINSMKGKYSFERVAVGIDNRPSSSKIAEVICNALVNAGIEPVYCGVLPTPALAYWSIQNRLPSIMVTGSHIPFDRNGLKFYNPDGEISKNDEKEICSIDIELVF